jgi:hypothetical protein
MLVAGVAVYVPMGGVSGHYAIPAVWGIYLGFGVLLSELGKVPATVWKRLARAALVCGLAAVALANVGRQDRLRARAGLLWQALECVETQVPAHSCLAVLTGPDLNVEEGIHFSWHLANRGRRKLEVCLRNPHGPLEGRPEMSPVQQPPAWLLSGSGAAPGPNWQRVREFSTRYWGGLQRQECWLWASKNEH